jgi:hypothetical protein
MRTFTKTAPRRPSLAKLQFAMDRLLGEQISDIQRVFYFWINVHRPNYILKQGHEDPLPVETIAQLRNVPKPDFLEAGLLGLAKARAKR